MPADGEDGKTSLSVKSLVVLGEWVSFSCTCIWYRHVFVFQLQLSSCHPWNAIRQLGYDTANGSKTTFDAVKDLDDLRAGHYSMLTKNLRKASVHG